MKIPVTLDGEKTVLEAFPYEKLINVLRRNGRLSAKCGCEEGVCGACTVCLDGKAIPSCIVPAALARDADIVTLDAFSKTEDYEDIAKGFNKAGIRLCGYCNAGKIFAARTVLNTAVKPARKMIAEQVSLLSPCCTNTDMLVDGILYAFDFKVQRMGAQKNAK